MRLLALLGIVLLAGCASAGPRPDGLISKNSAGHGFWVVLKQLNVQGGFESIGYFSHCYHNQLDLGQCDIVLPSPSGRLAIYQKASTGQVMLYSARSGVSTLLAELSPRKLRSAAWNSGEEAVTIISAAIGEPEQAQEISLERPEGGI
jgi:hypothetical protein